MQGRGLVHISRLTFATVIALVLTLAGTGALPLISGARVALAQAALSSSTTVHPPRAHRRDASGVRGDVPDDKDKNHD